MAILHRFNLRRRKAPKLVEQPKPTSEKITESSPPPFKDLTFFYEVTSIEAELVHLSALFQAAHHPQVLALRTSLNLKLAEADSFHMRNNVGRVFKGTLRAPLAPAPVLIPAEPYDLAPAVEERQPPAPVGDLDSTPPSTPLPEYFCVEGTFQPGVDVPDIKASTFDIVATPARRRSLHITDFVEEAYLGAGCWGHVHLFRHRATNMRVAIKSIQKQLVQGKEEQLLREQATLRAVAGQEGVLDLLGSFQDDATFYLVTRFYRAGDMLGLVEQMGPLPKALLVFYAAQLLVCVERVHARGVIHRDLKPANIFMDSQGNLALGDFGLATFQSELETGKKEFCGTMEYLSRDIWQGKQYSCASDVWAYGAVLFEMAVGRRMFESSKCKSARQVMDKVISGSLRGFLGKDMISRDLTLFLDEIFENDDDDRPTLSALKKHSFFASIDWKALEDGNLPSPIVLDGLDQDGELKPIEPGCHIDEDEEPEKDAFPEFNYISDTLIPVSSPAPMEDGESRESEPPLPAVVGLVPELEMPLPESAISMPILEPGLTITEVPEDIPSSHDTDAAHEPEPTPAAPVLPSIGIFETFDDDSCSTEADTSSPGDSTTSSSDDSSILRTPALDDPIFPTISAEPFFSLCGTSQNMPRSVNSSSSISSCPDITCPISPPAPSRPFVLPGGDVRQAVIVHTPDVEIMEPQRAEIVHVFGDKVEVDHDAEWQHQSDSTSDMDADRRKRFMEKIKRLSKVPKSLSRKF